MFAEGQRPSEAWTPSYTSHDLIRAPHAAVGCKDPGYNKTVNWTGEGMFNVHGWWWILQHPKGGIIEIWHLIYYIFDTRYIIHIWHQIYMCVSYIWYRYLTPDTLYIWNRKYMCVSDGQRSDISMVGGEFSNSQGGIGRIGIYWLIWNPNIVALW